MCKRGNVIGDSLPRYRGVSYECKFLSLTFFNVDIIG